MGTVLSINTELQEDPQRIIVHAKLVGNASPPSAGVITVSAKMEIWVADNPTWLQLQLRVMDTLARSFALTDEFRLALGYGDAIDQPPAAANP